MGINSLMVASMKSRQFRKGLTTLLFAACLALAAAPLAWGQSLDEAAQQAAEILAPGGRLLAVGIDEDDQFVLKHSTLRRKGLTIKMVRRMKHSYPRAMRLVEQGQIDLPALVSHHYPLTEAPEAFAANADADDIGPLIHGPAERLPRSASDPKADACCGRRLQETPTSDSCHRWDLLKVVCRE